MIKETKFTNKEYEELLKIHNQQYMRLVKWLYTKHIKIWTQYEKEKMGGIKLKMLK